MSNGVDFLPDIYWRCWDNSHHPAVQNKPTGMNACISTTHCIPHSFIPTSLKTPLLHSHRVHCCPNHHSIGLTVGRPAAAWPRDRAYPSLLTAITAACFNIYLLLNLSYTKILFASKASCCNNLKKKLIGLSRTKL